MFVWPGFESSKGGTRLSPGYWEASGGSWYSGMSGNDSSIMARAELRMSLSSCRERAVRRVLTGLDSNGACIPPFAEVRPGASCDGDGIERRDIRVSARGGGVAGLNQQEGVVGCMVSSITVLSLAPSDYARRVYAIRFELHKIDGQ
jgi:hypothetical protein